MDRTTLDAWLDRVEDIIASRMGMVLAVLPACCQAWYASGVTPAAAAGMAIAGDCE
jgi:hypothetical protein